MSPAQTTWWQEARDRWRAAHLQGNALRDPEMGTAIREAAQAAGVSVTQVIQAASDWPGQWEMFLAAVYYTGNIEVRPGNDPMRKGSCSCHIAPPCNYCVTDEYWDDWVLPGNYYGDAP